MPGSNLAEQLPPVVTSEGTEPPRLKLVVRNAAQNAAQEDSTPEKRHWLEDNLDLLLMILAVAAWIVGYTAFGVLAVSGR